MSLMLRACLLPGAEKKAIAIDTPISTAATSRLCHNPSVWLSGMTPLICSIASGSDAGAAMINAADDDKPSAQTLPTPR
jgi:hypothetical protein